MLCTEYNKLLWVDTNIIRKGLSPSSGVHVRGTRVLYVPASLDDTYTLNKGGGLAYILFKALKGERRGTQLHIFSYTYKSSRRLPFKITQTPHPSFPPLTIWVRWRGKYHIRIKNFDNL